MWNTTIATIDVHSASHYCVLLCLCGGAIVWQHTGHLSVAALSRGLSDRSVQMLNSFLINYKSLENKQTTECIREKVKFCGHKI